MPEYLDVKKLFDFYNGNEPVRLLTAYDDFVNILNLQLSLEKDLNGECVFDATKRGETEKANQIIRIQNQSKTLIKAAYMFASIYIDLILGRAVGEISCSFQKFLWKKGWPKVNVNELTEAYCISIYRNKLIAHHDCLRDSAVLRSKDGVFFQPLPGGFKVDDADFELLKSMKPKYFNIIQGVTDEENYYELLNKFFYGIPPEFEMSKEHDRLLVNNIAEKGGLKTKPLLSLLTTLNDFTKHMHNAIRLT